MMIIYRSDSVELDGYVVITKRDSSPISDATSAGAYFEQIMPGAFDQQLREKEVPVLLDHDKRHQIGTSRTNFEFHEDPIGLRVRATILDPEVIRKAKEGKLRGWSFAFSNSRYQTEGVRLNKKRLEELGDVRTRRKIFSFDLEEISLLDNLKAPVYDSLVEVRTARRPRRPMRAADGWARVNELELNSYRDRLKALEKKARRL